MTTTDCLAFVGTRDDNNEEIYSYGVDAKTGALDPLAVTLAGDNPSYLAIHPTYEYLYAVNQIRNGTVTAFSIDRESGELTKLNRRSSEGVRPCFCSVDNTGNYVMTVNYNSGDVAVLPIDDEGYLREATDVSEHRGSSVHPAEQTKPHPHSIVPGPENHLLFVPDLGTDQVIVYQLDVDNGTMSLTDCLRTSAGAGPRHLDFHPNGRFLYLVNELDSTLTIFRREPQTSEITEMSTVRTLPDGHRGKNTAADVHVHPTGRWVYASNRGHDSIAIFERAADGRLRPVDYEPTRGETPRNIALDPTGKYLLVANKDSSNIISFGIDDDTGRLTATGQSVEVSNPMCMELIPR